MSVDHLTRPTTAGGMNGLRNDSTNLLSLSSVEYDFEEYALNYGIPETLDPLPYRKAGSVFATGEEAEPVLTSAKHDPRLRTVVCRHWLRDLCMKGAACEFLHQYDLSKMPLCRHGERCKIKDCPFRHISEENRMECAFYKSGFCIHGPFCRYKHAKRPREDLPVVADFTLGLSQMQSGNSKEVATTKRPAPKPNEFYKISLCKHFAAGDCPFGEGCHFAHGEAELRKFPRAQDATAEGEEYDDQIFPDTTLTTSDFYISNPPATALSEAPENAQFFLIVAATQEDLAISAVRKEWYIRQQDAEKLNAAYYDIGAGSTRQVTIFFTVSASRHIQGCAYMDQPATYQEFAEQRQKGNGITDESNIFSYRVGIEWSRTVEYPVKSASEVAVQNGSVLTLPTEQEACVSVPWKVGVAIRKALWNLPTLPLYESWNHETSDDIPSIDNLLTDFRAPGGLRTKVHSSIDMAVPMMLDDQDAFYGNNVITKEEIPWPTMPGPGFIFGCSSDTMDECLGRGIFGLPANMKIAASFIKPGTAIFLFNVTDRLLFGIFEALTSAKMNIEPTAFSKNPKAASSPFPVQIRVRVSLECPPVEDTDPILNDILRTRTRGRIGPLSHAQTVAVASLLATQCGAIKYMIQHQNSVRAGKKPRPPPIALPPRIIKPKEKEQQQQQPPDTTTTGSITDDIETTSVSASIVPSNEIDVTS